MPIGEIYERIEAITPGEHQELIRYIRKYTRSIYTAEDFLQDAYLEALLRADQIRDPSKLIPWLKTVAKRKAIKQMTEYAGILKKYVLITTEGKISPEDEWLNRIFLSDLLCRVLGKFPPYYRYIVIYRNVRKMPYSQIAEKLGISSSAARQAHSRVIRAMKKEVRTEINSD